MSSPRRAGVAVTFPSAPGIQATPNPRFFMKSWNSALSNAFFTDAIIFCVMSAGMPAGPSTPRQVRIVQSLPAPSFSVGTFG